MSAMTYQGISRCFGRCLKGFNEHTGRQIKMATTTFPKKLIQIAEIDPPLSN